MVPAGRHLLEAALRAEGHAATGVDYLQVVYLSQYLQDGVEEPFLSKSADGDPIYCQWLIRPRHYRRLQEAMPGRYPALSDGEVVLEGAYTFLEFRGLRVMADGMSQLLRIAQQEGYTWATTYVAADNTAALRGCHHSGFQLYRAHLATHRFGRRRQRMVGTPSACAPWNRAVADPR